MGAGLAKHVLPTVSQVEVVAHVDAAAQVLADAQKAVGFPDKKAFASLSQAFNTVEADAVLVTVPLAAHAAVALEALAAGKHVLSKSPLPQR